MSKLLRILRRADDVAEFFIFDYALAPGRRLRTLGFLALLGGLLYGSAHYLWAPSAYDYIRLGDEALFTNHNPHQARQFYRKAIRADRKSPMGYIRMGQSFRTQQRYKKAMQWYRRALDRRTDKVTLFFAGEGYIHLKRPHVAMGFFDEALALDRRFAPALVYKGWALDRQKEYARALAQYQRALLHAPALPTAYFYRGITRFNLKQYDAGIRDFHTVIRLEPRESAAYYNIACGHSLKKDAPKALEWLKKAFEKGFREFEHMKTDPDLDFIRARKDYKALVAAYR